MNKQPGSGDDRSVCRRTLLRKAGLGFLGAFIPRGLEAMGDAKKSGAKSAGPVPKNIVLITTHDSGRHFGCYGHPTLHTPAIDRLAAEGCRFTRFFSINPICSPSRATLVTGRYPQSHGVMTIVSKKKGIMMNPGEKPLASVLGGAGFETALFGLQHESPDSTTLGFKHLHDGFPRKAADVVGREAGEFIRSTEAPFYLQVGFVETHTPYNFAGTAPDISKGLAIPPYVIDNDAARDWMAGYQGSVRKADQGVAEILRALDESGKAGDTLVIFTVDHGIELPRAKWFLYDAGVEVAFICRWPKGGIAAGSTSDLLLSHVDVFPTLMDLLGMPIPANVQGKSFARVFRGETGGVVNDALFSFQNGYEMRSVRTDRYKLIRNFELHAPCTCPGDVGHPRQDAPVSPLVELYDLEKDPLEFNNLAESAQHAGIRRELTRKLRHWMVEQKDPILRGTEKPTDFYKQALADLMGDA